jgi:restriction endonuclease Mrr
MAIPFAQDISLPLLQFAGDGKAHSQQEAVDALAAEFGLTPEERDARRPNGRARKMCRAGRCGRWCCGARRVLAHTVQRGAGSLSAC